MKMASELILGGQKSGKSRRAEALACAWLAGASGRRAVLVATALAHDDEMRERIARHRQDRARRVPGLEALEEPRHLARAIARCSDPRTLVVVDCLTLWLSQRLLPLEGAPATPAELAAETDALAAAVAAAPGPLVLVSNELGLGVVPLGRELRACVDALGQLNQRMAACCTRVTLVAAGLPLTLKDAAP